MKINIMGLLHNIAMDMPRQGGAMNTENFKRVLDHSKRTIADFEDILANGFAGAIMNKALETASDAAKLAILTATGIAAWIVLMPPTARAAEIAAPPGTTAISHPWLLLLGFAAVAALLNAVIPAIIDHRRYREFDRGIAERRARLQAENDEYLAAHKRADGEI